MTLNECCALAQDMTRIPITVLQTSTDCMLFCTQYQFHPLQEYLLPHTMKLFLEGLSENETVCVTDPFHLYSVVNLLIHDSQPYSSNIPPGHRSESNLHSPADHCR